jgi:hypothetical protein
VTLSDIGAATIVRAMSSVLAVLAVSLLSADSPNNAPTEKLDVAAQKAQFRAYTDGRKHYLIVQMDKEHALPEWAFYGDSKAMYRLRIRGGGGEQGVSWNLALWEPRMPGAQSFVDYRSGKLKVTCSDRNTELSPVAAEEAAKLIDGADYYPYRWTRQPYLLARDDKGTYYFVDMLRDVEGKKDMRLYIGARGKMKLQQMTNIVSDSVGDIFSTKSGELRLVANGDELKWVQGKTESKLTHVPVQDNAVLIYTDLGVYERIPLGSPCDDL